MLKKVSAVAVILLFLFAIPDIARPSVIGEWDVVGTLKVTVKARGLGSATETGAFVDHFVFHPDGTFEMIDLDGTWTQPRAKFTVLLDSVEVETYFEQAASDQGDNISADVRSMSFKGTEKNGTIKGSLSFKMTILFLDRGATGTLTAKVNFTGTPSAGGLISPLTRAPADASTGESLLGVLKATVLSLPLEEEEAEEEDDES